MSNRDDKNKEEKKSGRNGSASVAHWLGEKEKKKEKQKKQKEKENWGKDNRNKDMEPDRKGGKTMQAKKDTRTHDLKTGTKRDLAHMHR